MIEVKSQLAKLLATEDITVQHTPGATTAAFDVKSRVLHLPVWKNVSEDLFDMLVVHEVGHALDTPADGWVTAISNIGKKLYGDTKKAEMSIKQFLNIVEDVRIDKRQKRRYPGSKRNYVNGLKELHERDFFGLSGRDINGMTFIDRANIYYKGGIALNIKFKNSKERDFIRRMNETETFDEVVQLTTEIFEYAKNEEEVQEQASEEKNEIYEWLEIEGEGEGNEGGESSDEPTENEGKGSSKSGDNNDEVPTEGLAEGKQQMSSPGGGTNATPVKPPKNRDGVPSSDTETAAARNTSKIVAQLNVNYIYTALPEVVSIKDLVHDYKVVIPQMEKAITSAISGYNHNALIESNKDLVQWRKAEQDVIAYMVKEFEMRKAAETYARISVAKTGVINTNKLHSYRYNDDIFRRQTTVPVGKNHGFVMLLDWSGSMSYELKDTMKQLFSLTMFCKRVQIPFEVFLFKTGRTVSNQFKAPSGTATWSFGGVVLRNILSSRMNTSTLNKAMECLYYASTYGVSSDPLGGTPLNQAILALEPVIEEFRKKNKIQIVNTIILTDGGSDGAGFNHNGSNQSALTSKQNNFFLRDDKTKKTYDLGANYSGYVFTNAMVDILKNRTSSNMIGFYLYSGSVAYLPFTNNQGRQIEVTKEMQESWKNKGYIALQNAGYDEYYMLNVADKGRQSQVAITSNMSKTKISKLFSENSEKRKFSRDLLNRFIDRVARERF